MFSTIKGCVQNLDIVASQMHNDDQIILLSHIADITQDNVHIYSKHCGDNLTIVPKFPPENSHVKIEHDVRVQTHENVTEVVLFAVVDGVKGNQHIVTIPKSCEYFGIHGLLDIMRELCHDHWCI